MTEKRRAVPVEAHMRWNIERDGEDLLICSDNHEKGDKCNYQRYVPESKLNFAKRWAAKWKNAAKEINNAWRGQNANREDLRLQLQVKTQECQLLETKLELAMHRLRENVNLRQDASVQRLIALFHREQHSAEWLVYQALSLPSTQAKTEWLKSRGVVVMREDVHEDGRKYWYVEHPQFTCDIEEEENGSWSIFFRTEKGKEGFAEFSQRTEQKT